MPNTEQETRAAIAEFTVTKILGQPTTQDIDLLEDELTAIASSFPTSLGGGLHGHAGLLKTVLDYDQLAPGTPFVVLYQLISNICIFEFTGLYTPYIRIWVLIGTPHIRSYGFF